MLSTTPTSESESPCSVMCTGVMTITQIMTVCEHTIARIATSARGSRTAMRRACHEPTRSGGAVAAARRRRRGGTAGGSDAAGRGGAAASRMPQPSRRARRASVPARHPSPNRVDREVPRLRDAQQRADESGRARRRPPRTRTARRAAAARATGPSVSPVCESSGPATEPIVVAQSTSDIDARLEAGRRHLGRRESRLQARRGARPERREAEEHEQRPVPLAAATITSTAPTHAKRVARGERDVAARSHREARERHRDDRRAEHARRLGESAHRERRP